MGSKSSLSHFSLKRKPSIICLLLISLPFLLFVLSVKPHEPPPSILTRQLHEQENTDPPSPPPTWFNFVSKHLHTDNNIKIGLVNIDESVDHSVLDHLPPHVDIVPVDFDRVDENLKWEDFFPEWIDEDRTWGSPKCPRLPLAAAPESLRDLDVVVARVPCEGNRDVFRLQVNLVVANLAVEIGWLNFDSYRTVMVVFVGSCGPMVEIFRCDDLLTHRGEYWVYKPELGRLKQVTLMPVGSCQIAPNYAETGKETWRPYLLQPTLTNLTHSSIALQKVAYVTVLHSSEAYVCGAIALAQSILKTHENILNNPNTHLVLLADHSIGPISIRGLRAAGWRIKRIQRILSPFAKRNSYNRWNYSKLRIWQLTEYDKVVFIDSDLLVLKNIHHLSILPQLSAAPNDNSLFNSGLMVIEPSECMFHEMMKKSFKVASYNGGDQGFLNEIFTWWHRLPWRVNHLKVYERQREKKEKVEEPKGVYAIHYLGLKPWVCYKDYDCNWDMEDHQKFASDWAHRRWWKVYEGMPKELKGYCGLTKKMDEKLVKWRGRAGKARLSDGHWKMEIKDPRRKHYVG